MITNKELSAKVVDIATNYKTIYMWGVFGAPVSESIIKQKRSQYPSWYTTDRQIHLRSLIGKGYFAFDCVNLIKAVLWGWTGDKLKSYGGAVYNSNGVPDIDANAMIAKCQGVSTDFRDIEVGEAVWLPGHIGVYIGNGKVVECTPAWKNGVQISACLNIGPITGLNGRRWQKHGKMPYVKYEVAGEPEYIRILKAKTTAPDDWIKLINDNKHHPLLKYLPDLIEKIAK